MHHVPRKTAFNIAVKKSSAGLGVFTNVAIPKRRFIIEYWGDIVTEDEANHIGGKYLFELGNGRTVDGTTRKNIARYINHSCLPNCEVETLGNKIFVYSRRAIKAGEELTYNYGKDYFEHFIKPHGCRCKKHQTP
ncbi:MAG: SET domain-containing protein [Patescibacteria group bacterium]|jgi:hypothetical protein